MKRIQRICSLILLAAFWGMPVLHAQSFDNLWKQVEQAQKKSLPQTVIKLTDEIFRKGEREKNTPQMLKAYIHRKDQQEKLTPDSFYVNLKGLEQWAQQEQNVVNRAVLNSLVANIYADYANDNRWQLRRRASLDWDEDALPQDIREWSANLFVRQVMKYTAEALKDSTELLNTSSHTLIPFVISGDASGYYHHDMYHLLASRAIEALRNVGGFDMDTIVWENIQGIYEQMISAYRKMPDREDAVVLTTLDYWEWRRGTTDFILLFHIASRKMDEEASPYLRALNSLIKDYAQREVCAEVYLAKAWYYCSNFRFIEALQYCDEAINRYPKYKRISALYQRKEDILHPRLIIRADDTGYPGDSLLLQVDHQNLDGFTIHLYRTTLTEPLAEMPQINSAFYKKYARKVKTEHFSLSRPKDYQLTAERFSLLLPDEPGIYVMQTVPDGEKGESTDHFIYLTRFEVLTLSLPSQDKKVVAMVLDAATGKPVADAEVIFYSTSSGANRKEISRKTTNALGKVMFTWSTNIRALVARKGTDTAMPSQRVYYRSSAAWQNGRKEVSNELKLLTDRSLYRPGQTIYVKGIAYTQKSDTADVVPDKEYDVVLRDVNRREIGKKSVRTNEFGSFATEFVLPAACLNGSYNVEVSGSEVNASASVRVEEYKRPTFDIVFNPQRESYQIGDSVQVKGQAGSFSGVPLQGVKLDYTVTRDTYSWWRNGLELGGIPIASGSVTIGDNGEFAIPVCLEGNNGENDSDWYYTYQVKASVTNLAGETQTAITSLAAGNRSLILSVDGEERICKDDSVKQTFHARNLNGEPVSVEGKYRLMQVINGDSLVSIGGHFTSNVETLLPEWKNLPSGLYELQLNAKDAQGRNVDFKKTIVLFSYGDNRPAAKSDLWFYVRNEQFDATHPAQFSFGTSLKDVYVMLDVFSGKRYLKSNAFQLSDSIVRFNIPYSEEYGDGVGYLFTFVKNGKVYQERVMLKKRMPDKALKMKWEVFRDKLLPGQEEEWRLTIKSPQGNTPAMAEILATMYDASLDKIYPNRQSFSVAYRRNVPNAYWEERYRNNLYYYYTSPLKNWKVPVLIYDSFYSYSLSEDAIFEELLLQEDVMEESPEMHMIAGVSRAPNMEAGYADTNEAVEVRYVPPTEQVTAVGEAVEPSALRTNFAETAFFYPQLRTNGQGEVSFAFTMPQSLTRWNFRGYAHTKGMLTGMLNASAVTAKEFMLSPNMPRFVRVGDKTNIAATVTNLTGKELKGTATFALFDPMTDKVISTQRRAFTVAAGKVIPVSFSFTITGKYDILGVRMIADGGTFSDGEQHLLPVLDNKEYVTETLAMPVRGEQTRTFSLDSLFNYNSRTATNRRLTVEFTGNPAWYAVQALPALSQPRTDNATSWAVAYYANSLASYIANSQPRIKAVFDSWRMQGGKKETFLSQLQKNRDVKNILLEETPWLMEATTEAEQQARIATLFDLNNLSNNNVTILTKLQELQDADGSWSWYKGMPGNRSMTGYITGLLVRLPILTGQKNPADALSMQQKAFNYLHNQALEEYKNIRKAEKNGAKATTLSSSAMQYLYLIAVSGEKVPALNEEAYRYFLSMVRGNLNSTAMGVKAQSAIVLQKAGLTAEADEFVASLKEHLVQTDERGAYFAFYETPYLWGMHSVSVQVEVMEALRLAGGNDALVEEMKLWLLKQKQTTSWNSPVVTADAVYALLCQGIDLLASRGDVRIVLGNKVMETAVPVEAAVPGLGYLKESFAQGSPELKAKSVTVEKRDAGIAWGAVYAQYLSPVSDVRQQGGELAVEKKLFVERTLTGGKKELQPITASTRLAVGDKVVSRLTIRLDRAMDFVQLKDQRGACFEPENSLSGYRWGSGTGYYVEIEDASTNFFFDKLSKGVYVLEYSYRVARSGQYEAGLATIQSAYTPEYAAHSASGKVDVE
ncbi:alpha-2-macroglobulin family protein [Bacteroides sp. UBA939]|uniref:alpha-2-macroglobulin family protein n=1 Tax=Bacteroides sp. UBA939 TaxID=1946092 RepID=UPI0025C1D7DE|nr:alpha-2-macroglobulin family protein [Bacteroides sp. UBA939]